MPKKKLKTEKITLKMVYNLVLDLTLAVQSYSTEIDQKFLSVDKKFEQVDKKFDDFRIELKSDFRSEFTQMKQEITQELGAKIDRIAQRTDEDSRIQGTEIISINRRLKKVESRVHVLEIHKQKA